MKILNRKISYNTQKIIDDITPKLLRPVEYFNISAIPIEKLTSFGCSDFSSNPNKYLVYLSTALNDKDFETNLLHELFHIIQYQNNIPFSLCKKNNITASNNNYFLALQVELNSTILDLDVVACLDKLGYNSSYFTNSRYEKILNIPLTCKFKDKYDLAHLSVQLVLFFLTCSDKQYKSCVSFINSNFENAATPAVELSKTILKIGFETNIQQLLCICELINYLNLWDILYVVNGDLCINTSKQFVDYKNSLNSYTFDV